MKNPDLEKILDRMKLADNPHAVRDLDKLGDNVLAMLVDCGTPVGTLAAFILERRIARIGARATIFGACLSGILGGILGFSLAKIEQSEIFGEESRAEEAYSANKTGAPAFEAVNQTANKNEGDGSLADSARF